MSDELKDFRYYADKAEASLKEARDYTSPERQGSHDTVIYMLKTAAVYAELAKSAPKSEPVTPCNVGLHGYREGMYDRNTRPCVYAKGHAGYHQTDDGVNFRGLDNLGYPGPGGDEPSRYAHISREELERSHAELQDVRNALKDAGVESIPPVAGVRDLRAEISELIQERANHNANAVAEMVKYVKDHQAHDARWWGMLDVLAKFLVVMGRADNDDRHSVARRLCGIEE
jgi:hypothetical protein